MSFKVGIIGYGWAATAHIDAVNAGGLGDPLRKKVVAETHDNPSGQRLTAFMICKGLADSAVPMSLLADYSNVVFNFYRGGIGTVDVEMH